MKRILVALSLAALVAPAFAVEISAPYEETQADRQLPNVPQRSSAPNQTQGQTQGNVWANDYNFIAPAP